MKAIRCDAKAPVTVLGAMVVLVLAFWVGMGDLHLSAGASAGSQAALTVGAAAVGETAAYVKFEGINGESEDQGHRNWSDLLSFGQGQFIASPATGSVRVEGRLQFEDVVLTKQLDKSSPKLAEAVCNGRVFPTVDVEVTAALFGRPLYYAYELKNVRVTSYHVSGSAAGDRPTESLSLNFEQIKVTYTEFDAATGASKGNVEYTWKVEEGTS